MGGVEVFLQQLVSRLDRRRFEPSVLSLCPIGRVGERIRELGVPIDSLDQRQEAGPRELVAAVRQLRSRLRRQPVDLVHSQLYRANVVTSVAARLVRPRPVVVTAQHSLYAMTGKSAERVARWLRPLSDVIVAVSPVVRDYLMTSDGVPAEKIRVINNGVDVERFRPGSESALRERLSAGPDTLLVGVVGRLSEEKGIDLLLDAMAQLRSRAPRLRLAIVGDGPERAALELRVERLGLGDQVVFLGMRQDIDRLLRAFDVFAMPSRKEALPIALLEAMASGCCIVASRVGGIPLVLEDGVEGRLCEADSVSSLRASLEPVLEDPELRSRLARAARERVESELTLDQTARQHERLYSELLSLSRR